MVGHTILKKRHSLTGMKLLPIIRRVRSDAVPKDWARMSASKATEDMDLTELGAAFTQLTGEALQDEVDLAGRSFDLDAARLVVHHSIIYANEVGQPKGQELQMTESVQAGASTSGLNASQQSRQNHPFSAPTDEPSVKKLRTEDTSCLLQRIEQLEQEKLDNVDLLREKGRTLATQSVPSDPLILLTLDELAKTSRKVGHPEVETFEELARQATRHHGKVCLPSLCLSVLSGKASDLISKALRKCKKEISLGHEKPEENCKDSDTRASSPLNNLYPLMYPQYPPIPGFGFPRPAFPRASQYFRGTSRMGRPGYDFRISRIACHFCASTSHLVRDCQLMKKARKQ